MPFDKDMTLYFSYYPIIRAIAFRICGCKGKKKNFIRQTFFVIQKNMLSLQQFSILSRILFCEIHLRQEEKTNDNRRKTR